MLDMIAKAETKAKDKLKQKRHDNKLLKLRKERDQALARGDPDPGIVYTPDELSPYTIHPYTILPYTHTPIHSYTIHSYTHTRIHSYTHHLIPCRYPRRAGCVIRGV
jgi:hypothetical protein